MFLNKCYGLIIDSEECFTTILKSVEKLNCKQLERYLLDGNTAYYRFNERTNWTILIGNIIKQEMNEWSNLTSNCASIRCQDSRHTMIRLYCQIFSGNFNGYLSRGRNFSPMTSFCLHLLTVGIKNKFSLYMSNGPELQMIRFFVIQTGYTDEIW